MSRNVSDHKLERQLINTVRRVNNHTSQQRTRQDQGAQSIQIGYTDDAVFHYNVAPNTGLIGTFVFSLQYDDPIENSVVFGDVDIAVNKGTDTFGPPNTLDPYFGALQVEVINSQYFVEGWHTAENYYPIVKVVRLSTFSSPTPDDFYIHYRWRYVGVGSTLLAVTGDISILP